MKNKPTYFPNLDRDCSWESPVDVDGVQVSSCLDVRGMEVPDPTPMAPPVGMSSGPSLADFVHRMIRQEVERNRLAEEQESFDEADDFDVEDDPIDPLTPYEKHFEAAAVPENWPMYYNPKTGLYGQLPPNEQPPEGFELLVREKELPRGYVRPRGEGGAAPPTDKPTSEAPKPSDPPSE